ncbi:MAG: cobalamin biosynthesis protein CbiM [Gammaproteobacteria bacterium]|nr:MAG: cobalamin biosynthesis protein CbiM [Gammaproteobacteria bacterium]
MHIPDGLLSPQTFLPAFVLAVPAWWWASRRARRQLDDALLPRLAVFTALAFLLSTLMLPLPGGTSGHALGVALLALCFGVPLAFLAYTLVLVLQALALGAGGLTALPVNALCMGLVGALVATGAYRLFAGLHTHGAVLLATWLSVMVSATLVALVLGMQPLIARDAGGAPLFFPFGPAVTLPAILLPHALLAAAEAALTLLVWRHARRRHWLSHPA